ncbi:hypothetical protein PRIPAC_92534 [Pristionchus pacificus]|uniref:Probable 26S proteasome regulatory subunit rpn-6.2 n=1 Tax=Pristionchus pacificus TaxID=54126 RepID=A0A2A6D435_PRIPA|nr:hypothetical protein PRIPAC_92534 [Pristionchus pacificus]|eukprot:PDM84941.1 hypothetical protein PRIPAC_36375 [Pristionchus pacificus]
MSGGPEKKRLKLQQDRSDPDENEDESGELEDALVTIKEEFAKDLSKASEEVLKEMEETVLECAADLAKDKRTEDLLWTLTACRAVLPFLGKAKASRMLRTLLDLCLQTEEMKDRKIQLCNECIEWATAQKRTFLRRSLQARLIRLHNDNFSHTIALEMAGKLIAELKKMEDRELLVEVVLEESKAAFALNNPNKARTSLVMAKTVSNTAFMTPVLQASIDLQSGILAAEENDFRTAFSYFYEAFENFEPIPGNTNECIKTLKYMCLGKIVLDEPEHIKILLTGKRKYESIHLEAMKSLGKAFEKRSLAMYHEANAKFEKELRNDVVIAHHSARLYDKLFEKEVIRVVEPYDVVDLDHLVTRIGLPMAKIERSVSGLILDGRIKGVLDQSTHTLTIYRPASSDTAYKKAVNLIHVLERIVDNQYSHGRVH